MTNNAMAYHFLSLCLMYPQPDLAAQLNAIATQTDAMWMKELATAFAVEELETLQIEHTRLFVNNVDGVPCPPYEAAYIDGQLLTLTTADVAKVYAKWGLEKTQETADYLPAELQFLAYLIELSAQVEDRSAVVQARRQFEKDHLHRWLPKFAAALQQHAQLPFYRAVGAHLGSLLPHNE